MSVQVRRKLVLLPLALFVGACAGADSRPDDGAGDPPAHPATTPPISVSTDPVDEALAAAGREVFAVKGCVACHYVGQEDRLVGPDLAGVTQRRTWPWFYAMVTNPDSMTRNDQAARSLLGEYMTPMSRQGLNDDEVRSVWEFLRSAPAVEGG